MVVLTVDGSERLVVHCEHYRMEVTSKQKSQLDFFVKKFELLFFLDVPPPTGFHMVMLTVHHEIFLLTYCNQYYMTVIIIVCHPEHSFSRK